MKTKRTQKTIAIAVSYDERRFGSFRAVNYGVSGIVVYHDSDRRQGLACVETWEEAETWCATL